MQREPSSSVSLWADRFVIESQNEGDAGVAAHDLATGERVMLITSSAGGPSEQLHWALRCGRFASVHHPHLATLVDFGVLGADDGRRFEAWRVAGAWCGASDRASVAVARVNAYLQACDLLPCERPLVMAASGAGSAGDLPVVIPDAKAGREPGSLAARVADGRSSAGPLEPMFSADTIRSCGIDELTRPAVRAVIELLGDGERRDPRAVALWGAPGCGLRVATRTIARVARLQGFVPIDAAVDDPALWQLVAGRSLLLIDRRGDGGGWRRFLDAAGTRARAHLLMLTATTEIARVHSLHLEPVTRDALIDAVRPHAWRVGAASAVARAADAADGLPARFAAALWRETSTAPRRLSLAAEGRPPYGAPTASPSVVTPSSRPTPVPRAWPVSGDVAALRQKLAAAVDPSAMSAAPVRLLAARQERELRVTVTALARRRDWGHAARGAAALAAQCERRGRPHEAQRWLSEARAWAERAADPLTLGSLGLVSSALQLAAGSLGEAESTARSVLVAARARGDRDQALRAAVALSRSLFWQARYAEALDAVRAYLPGRLPGDAEAPFGHRPRSAGPARV